MEREREERDGRKIKRMKKSADISKKCEEGKRRHVRKEKGGNRRNEREVKRRRVREENGREVR